MIGNPWGDKPEFWSVAYGNGLFAAVADSKVLWSRDGTPGSWKVSDWKADAFDSAPLRHLAVIAFLDGRFVAVGTGGEIVWSPDGSPGSWTESRTGGPDLRAITYGNGRFMAVGSSGRVMISANGSAGSWTEILSLFE